MLIALRLAASGLVLGAVLAACGGGAGAGGAAVRPKETTAREALGESPPSSAAGGSCTTVADFGQPLVLDWRPHERANLEEAMASAVAVVAYDCHALRLLGDCHVEGSYGTLGVSRKEEVVELENADEITANLPSFGGKLVADLRTEMQRGTTLELAMIIVGKKRTTVRSVERAKLRGTCDGATHFIRGAFMGAFAMGTGTRGAVATAAQLFGAGTSAQSSSSKLVRNKDGDPNICTQVEAGAASLPSGCSAILRLELSPIVASAASTTEPPNKPDMEAIAPSCPPGLVFGGGKCSQPVANRPHDCKYGSASECTEECEKGSARSCGKLGSMYARGDGVAYDPAKAVPFFQKACDAGDVSSCANLGAMYGMGEVIPKDSAKAVALLRIACDGGSAPGCYSLGYMHIHGDGVAKDTARAIALYRKACDAGDSSGCNGLGVAYVQGNGVAKDVRRGVSFVRKACEGGNDTSCRNLVDIQRLGLDGLGSDARKTAFEKACEAGGASDCYALGEMYEQGRGVAKDAQHAVTLYRKACTAGHKSACADDKRLSEALAGMASGADEALYQEARAALAQGDRKTSRTKGYEVISRFPNSKRVGDVYNLFGTNFLTEARAGDPSKYDLAIQAFQEALKHPASETAPRSLLGLGQACDGAKKPCAADAYRKLREKYPNSPEAKEAPRR